MHRLVRGYPREHSSPNALFQEIRALHDRVTTLSAEVERLNDSTAPAPAANPSPRYESETTVIGR